MLSQLKHSTRHPDIPWTAAAFCAARQTKNSSGPPRSVARDLAKAYSQINRDFGNEGVDKTAIGLVTNRPIDPDLRRAVQRASDCVQAQAQAVDPRQAELLKALPPADEEIIRTLAAAVGSTLTSTQFCRFLTRWTCRTVMLSVTPRSPAPCERRRHG